MKVGKCESGKVGRCEGVKVVRSAIAPCDRVEVVEWY